MGKWKGYRCYACGRRLEVFRGDQRIKFCSRSACVEERAEEKRIMEKERYRQRWARVRAEQRYAELKKADRPDSSPVREVNLAELAIEKW